MAARKPKVIAELEQLCAEHFPHGWSHVADRFSGVGCEHGTWTRPGTETEPTPAPDAETTPAPDDGTEAAAASEN